MIIFRVPSSSDLFEQNSLSVTFKKFFAQSVTAIQMGYEVFSSNQLRLTLDLRQIKCDPTTQAQGEMVQCYTSSSDSFSRVSLLDIVNSQVLHILIRFSSQFLNEKLLNLIVCFFEPVS
jgi:hypothetical protein